MENEFRGWWLGQINIFWKNWLSHGKGNYKFGNLARLDISQNYTELFDVDYIYRTIGCIMHIHQTIWRIMYTKQFDGLSCIRHILEWQRGSEFTFHEHNRLRNINYLFNKNMGVIFISEKKKFCITKAEIKSLKLQNKKIPFF